MLDKFDALARFYVLAWKVAIHLGKFHLGSVYSAFNDPDVIAFIENAAQTQIGLESQQIEELDKLDKELA